jgi:hypothetical protein
MILDSSEDLVDAPLSTASVMKYFHSISAFSSPKKITGNRENQHVNSSCTSRILCKAEESEGIFHSLEMKVRNQYPMSVARR